MIFAEHINRLLHQELGIPEGWFMDKSMALIGVWGITAINCSGFKAGAKVAGWFLFLKLLMTVLIVLASMVVRFRDKDGCLVAKTEAGQRIGERTAYREKKGAGNAVWNLLGEYVSASLAALWVYRGWESVSGNVFHRSSNVFSVQSYANHDP